MLGTAYLTANWMDKSVNSNSAVFLADMVTAVDIIDRLLADIKKAIIHHSSFAFSTVPFGRTLSSHF